MADLPILDDASFAAAEAALLGPKGPALARAMAALSLGQQPPPDYPQAGARLEELGWIKQGRLTAIGNVVKDPLREWFFWEQRHRRLPSENETPVLDAQRLCQRDVVEVGAGGGCNLLTLGLARRERSNGGADSVRLVGVEPMPVYRQMAPVIAAMARCPAPKIVDGWGRSLPFEDRSVDVVLCYSAHQYMHVDAAFAEMGRILRPSGELIVVGNTLLPFAAETALRATQSRNLGWLKYDLTALMNTVGYQLSGRRPLPARDATTTSRPIYPTRGHLRRAARAASLVPCLSREHALPSGELVFVAVRAC